MARTFLDVMKDQPDVGDVHVPTALGNERRKKPKKPGEAEAEKSDWSISLNVVKVDDEERAVWVWASVTHESGNIVTDVQGDQIEVPDIVKAADEYMTTSRDVGDMHRSLGKGSVTQSLVFTPELQKQLGIQLDKVGWLVKMKVTAQDVWDRVKSGELCAASIGGTAVPVMA